MDEWHPGLLNWNKNKNKAKQNKTNTKQNKYKTKTDKTEVDFLFLSHFVHKTKNDDTKVDFVFCFFVLACIKKQKAIKRKLIFVFSFLF